MRPLLLAPLLAFLVVLGVVAVALWKPADRTVHSALVGQQLPEVTLPPLLPEKPGAIARATGRPRLLNVFASWCVPCIAEAPQLMRLKEMGVTIDAVAVRDTPAAIRDFLARNGDPYTHIGDDARGRLQLALGSSGVPETFVIAADGTILAQHIGDIREDEVAVRDTPAAIRDFLARNGDPYTHIGDDARGRLQLALGSSGVPETFVIAADGTILAQHIGDIREDEVAGLAAMAGVR